MGNLHGRTMGVAQTSARDARPARRHHEFGVQLPADVKLETAGHAVHAHVARAPAPQMYDQTDVGQSQQDQDQDIRVIHDSI